MNATTTKIEKKSRLLKALIDHPRTGAAERAAALRMLARLMASAKKNGVTVKNSGWVDHRAYGAKYDQARNMDLTQIAKRMRDDVKLARKIGKQAAEPGSLALHDPIGSMPDQVKISIRREYFSGGGAIEIIVKNIPRGWGYSMQPDRHHPQEMREQPTQALRDLAAALKEIHAAYNYDGSDITTDYFDVRFYGGVTDEQGCSLA